MEWVVEAVEMRDLIRTAQETGLQKEPGDTGSGERTKRRILRHWVASFSGGLGIGFCVSDGRKSRAEARLFRHGWSRLRKKWFEA